MDNTKNTELLTKKLRSFSIPYVKSISEKFFPIVNMFNCKLVYFIPNLLKNFIKKGKDGLDPLCNQNVVYKIFCDNCNVNYVSQTKRQLKIRLQEHTSDINKKSKLSSMISNHRIDHNHNFK